ncbi:MAG: flagellar type III secretion system pore protein FliP [Syntrophobacteraceae bacterium]
MRNPAANDSGRPARSAPGLFPAAVLLFLPLLACLAFPEVCSAAGLDIPALHFNLDDAKGPQQIAGILQIVFLLTVLSLAPAILILMTSFTRLAIVLSFLRHALGTQQAPPNQIIVGLALFLTFFIMQPVWQRIHQEAIIPYQQQKISSEELIDRGAAPLKEFMLKNTHKGDLALFVSISQKEKPQNAESLPISTVIPAFVISELKTAFQIGFMLYIPFIILDMVVSSILLSMGMMMLPPVMISLPFKLMLFILVDGWNLLIGSLVKSFQ